MQPPKGPRKFVLTQKQLRTAYSTSRRRRQMRTYKTRITPHWFHKGTRFWYRNTLPENRKEFVVVDAQRGSRSPAFDHKKLAHSLSRAAGKKYQADQLPFDRIEFTEDGKVIRFTINRQRWKCTLPSHQCTKAGKGSSAVSPAQRASRAALDHHDSESVWPEGLFPDASQPGRPFRRPRRSTRSPRSPDGKWIAFVKAHNVYIRSRKEDKEVQLSRDGKEGFGYGRLQWAPDSQTLIAFRIKPGERKEVYLVESSPRSGGRAKLHTRPYALPGDRFTSYQLTLFRVEQRKQIRPTIEPIDFGRPRLRWKRDGVHFLLQKVDRGHQRFRLWNINSHTGKVDPVIDEKTKTFIWTAHGSALYVRYLSRTDEMVYGSERDGWRHLYLVDARTGKVKNRITQGKWVVRRIDRVDEVNRQIWFQGSGKNPEQDPYLLHHYRVNFDGTGLVALTAGNGTHSIQFSPDRTFLIDTYSRVDQAPVHELRRVKDGKLICKLEEADISELKKSGWEAPEVFKARGRDGKTDIWGVLYRPQNLDANKRYPVIEYIYAGPHDSHVPKRFSAHRRFAHLTDLGFVVVQIDGMGTANRSKAFHDVCWKNLKDAGFPDRILWHRALARKYPWYDISRVGIYGTSAGGQSSTGALLFHGDFYKVAVSACGCHDNRMDKASWNEQWMGYPVGPHYAANSNITNAHRLRGKLLLIVGEMDRNVPPESTMRLVDALIKAGKDFDLLVMPGMGHSSGGRYGVRRLKDFFVRHLHGVAPPNWNAITR